MDVYPPLALPSLTYVLDERKKKMMAELQHRSTQNASSRLMRLPAELRSYIYELAIVKDKPIEVVELVRSGSSHYYRRSSALQDPALARVSTQLRHEVIPIFYSVNKFNVTATRVNGVYAQQAECIAGGWLRELSVANQKDLRKIGICTALPSKAVMFNCQYSQLCNLAERRRYGGGDYGYEYASILRLKGWTWEGDVKTEDECEQRCAQGDNVKTGGMHHHALVWTG